MIDKKILLKFLYSLPDSSRLVPVLNFIIDADLNDVEMINLSFILSSTCCIIKE